MQAEVFDQVGIEELLDLGDARRREWIRHTGSEFAAPGTGRQGPVEQGPRAVFRALAVADQVPQVAQVESDLAEQQGQARQQRRAGRVRIEVGGEICWRHWVR